MMNAHQKDAHAFNLKISSKQLAIWILGLALITVCSQIRIPLRPIPITLQTVAVFLIGLTCSPRSSAMILLGYLTLGASGWSVFSGFQGGFDILLGPAGGYLLGFLIAGPTMSYLMQRQSVLPSTLKGVLSCLFGYVIIYGVGLAWLAHLLGLQKAWAVGVVPFVLPELIKVAILITLMQVPRHINIKKH